MVLERRGALATVVVFDGDPVIGQVLGSLLRLAGYDTRYVDRDFIRQPGVLDGVKVVLLGPGWNSKSREVAAQTVKSNTPMAEKTRILEMGLPPDGVPVSAERYVPWPCRTEDLKRRIDDALLTGPRTAGGARREG